MNTEQIMLLAYKEEIAETNRHFPLAAEYANAAPEFIVTVGDDDMETRSSFECNKRKVMEYHSKRIELYLKYTNRG
ncbi:MAG: hypothetical protein KBD64_08355 [Gammaproteobacteria bacterium]|nr:hypothetical protein [Gammaproteobacteria bacterium]